MQQVGPSPAMLSRGLPDDLLDRSHSPLVRAPTTTTTSGSDDSSAIDSSSATCCRSVSGPVVVVLVDATGGRSRHSNPTSRSSIFSPPSTFIFAPIGPLRHSAGGQPAWPPVAAEPPGRAPTPPARAFATSEPSNRWPSQLKRGLSTKIAASVQLKVLKLFSKSWLAGRI